MNYLIADEFLESLNKKMARFAKKCALCGQPFTYEVGDKGYIEVRKPYSPVKYVPAHHVEVSGFAKLNGWTFVAKIDHLQTGNVICNAPSMKCPESYRDAKPFCDHCKTSHHRKETFVIVNENGEYRQVGRNCLALYTNGLNAEACAEYASIAHELEQEDGYYGGSAPMGDLLQHLVAVCVYHIAEVGYDREKLSFRIPNSLCAQPQIISGEEAYKMHKERVDAIIAEARNMTADSDYMANVKAIMAEDVVMPKHTFFVASFVYRFMKEEIRRKTLKSKAAISQHVGQIGERIEIRVPVVNGNVGRVLYTKHYSTGYTTSEVDVLEIIDVNGNVFKWSASSLWEMNEACEGKDEIVIKATVKDHAEYKGVKQTVITRCKPAK